MPFKFNSAPLRRGHLEIEGLEADAADTVLDNHSLIPFPQESFGYGGGGGGGGDGVGVPPLSMAATAHHVLVLFPSHIVAVNVVTGDVANTVPLARLNPLGGDGGIGTAAMGGGGGMGMGGMGGGGGMMGGGGMGMGMGGGMMTAQENARCLATDVSSGTVYLITATALLEVTARDESRDMWRVHLDRNEFSLALEHCGGVDQRGAVHVKQAEMATRAGEHARAAAYYAKAGNAVSFEAVCLGFLESGEDDALALYLQRRLDATDREKEPQTVKTLANWLADLHVCRACQTESVAAAAAAAAANDGDGGGGGSGDDNGGGSVAAAAAAAAEAAEAASAAATADLRAFLSDYAPCLDPAPTRKLLGDYGREEDLAYFAEVNGDWQGVLGFCLRKGYWQRAVGVLRKPQVPASDVYQVAPRLFRLAPAEAVDFFIAAGPDRLEPEKLLPVFGPFLAALDPATMKKIHTKKSAAAAANDEEAVHKREAIRFLQHAVTRQMCTHGSVHNCLLLLLVDRCGEDPNALMRYVAGAGVSSGGKAHYDQTGRPPYVEALAGKACEAAGALKAAIHIYCDVGDYDYAVELALRADDVETAKLVVEKVNETSGDGDGDGDGDRTRRRKKRLWRKIARGVIERGFGVTASEDDIQAERLQIKARMRESAKVAAMVAKEARDGGRGPNEEELWGVEDPDDWEIDGDGMRITEGGHRVEAFPVSRHEAEAGAVSKAANASPSASDPTVRAAVIQRALALVPDSEGVLAVEDLLPYFPDFTVIDEFKHAVLEELGKYSKRIDDSRAEMDKAHALADKIRGEIAEISQRTIRLPWDAPCAKCGGVITLPPQGFAAFAVQGQNPEEVASSSPLSQFYAFPCGMAFHTTCLIECGLPWMAAGQRRRCLDLMAVVQPPLTRELKKLCKRLAGRDRDSDRKQRQQQTAAGASSAGAGAGDTKAGGGAKDTKAGGKNTKGGGGSGVGSGGGSSQGLAPSGEGGGGSSSGGGDGKGKDNAGSGSSSGAAGASSSSANKDKSGGKKGGGGGKGNGAAAVGDKILDKGKAIEQLEDLLCEECPFCGEMMLRQISAPFIDPEDDSEDAKSWII